MATPSKKPSAHPKKTPSSISKASGGGEYFDPQMEYDAPMYRDFKVQTPQGEEVDKWFELRLQQINNREFMEPDYSPITFKKGMEKKGKTRTPSTHKKKVLGSSVVTSSREEPECIPKMSLEEASEPKGASPVRVESVAKPFSMPIAPAVVIHVAPKVDEKPAEPVPLPFQSMQGRKPAVPPIRKQRKLWAKPDMGTMSQPVAVCVAEEAPVAEEAHVADEPQAEHQAEPEEEYEVPAKKPKSPVPQPSVLRPSRTSRVANLLSKTPAPRLAAKTPAVSRPKSPPKAKTVVTKKPTIPVSPRCYHTRNTRSQAQNLTRSQTQKPEPQAKQWATTLTKPKAFSFMSKPAPQKPKVDYVPEKVKELSEFQSLLRADDEPAPRGHSGLTRPVEFQFATTARLGKVAPPKEDAPAPSVAKGLTQPKEFSFATSRRTRSAVQSVPEPQPSKLRQTYGAPAAKSAAPAGKRVTTVPHAFNLSSSNRTKRTLEPLGEPTAAKVAKARAGPVTHAPPAKRTLTVPVTPHAARKRKSPEKVVVEEAQPFKARPVPQAKQFVPAETSRHLTIVEPFELVTEIRGAEKEARFQHEVEVVLHKEEEARHFVARPVPKLDAPKGVPEVEPAHLTVFEPFHLQSETLSAIARQKLEERIQHEQALEEEMRKFKANPPPSMKRAPFRLIASNRPLTVAATPDLKSKTRAIDRADFSVEKNQRIQAKEARELHEKVVEEENEREEVRKLRKTLVFKAAPFVDPSPMRPAPSTRPLTVPESPQLRTNLRNMR